MIAALPEPGAAAPGYSGVRPQVPIHSVRAGAYRVPTESPESDGTIAWDATTIVVIEAAAADGTGLGYSYASRAAAVLVDEILAEAVAGRDALDVAGCWWAMARAVRNVGKPGIASHAIAAVDSALWDLKARLLGVSLLDLLGAVRDSIPVYGSGGFTSQSEAELAAQLGGWAAQGVRSVKMKIGRDPAADPARIAAARRAIGEEVDLMVDANGALDRKRALALAQRLPDWGVTWFEEPVSSDDLEGLRLLRDATSIEITAGEYGYDRTYFRRMLEAGAVDVLQADATRCGGLTGFLAADALATAFHVPLSAHTAPSLHAAVCCACQSVRHAEYFADHVRLEAMLFDGALQARDGRLVPDRSAPGMGLAFRRADAARFAVIEMGNA